MTKMLRGINYMSCGNVAPCKSILLPLNNIVAVLPELGREDAIQAFVYGLKPYLKGFVKV